VASQFPCEKDDRVLKKVLVFGGSGTLGSAVAAGLRAAGFSVLVAGRKLDGAEDISTEDETWSKKLADSGVQLAGVVWAQGTNYSGDAVATEPHELREVLEANVTFIHSTFRELHRHRVLAAPCRTVVLSSIWEKFGRNDKFAYMVSKAALAGLVKSLAIDFADQGVTCNAVLPGVVDSPMTRANLSVTQLRGIQQSTPGGQLVTVDEVAQLVVWLISLSSSGVQGESIVVDKGWSSARLM
jgi:NAD(P)-dependent dehydrogenase (short-subunit alcohol dehydrogenase family)